MLLKPQTAMRFVSITLTLLSFLSSCQGKELIECTVFTIDGVTRNTTLKNSSPSPDNDSSYICKTDNNFKTYKVQGDIRAFLGSSYKSSQTTFTFPAFIISDNKVLDIDSETVRTFINVSNPASKDIHMAAVARNQGTHKGLIIRVVDKTGDAPIESENDLYSVFFNKNQNYGVSVKSVFLGCSDEKFKLIPATGSAVNNGVITVTVNYAVAGVHWVDVSDSARALLPSSIDSYTYTMIVVPASVDFDDSAGFGEVPGTFTWYLTDYVQWIYIGVHEIGHNLGLRHSGSDFNQNGVFESYEQYDDQSCQMGKEWGEVYDGQKCFNAAKTYYLGWFSDYHGSSTPASSSFSGTLVGINDATNDEISSGQFVTVKISGSGETDLFMMYNRVEGVNKFLYNIYFRDKVVVVEQNGMGGQSWVRAVLDEGETYSQSNWAGTGNALKIKVCDIRNGSPDVAEVGVWLNNVNSVDCEAAPTVSPAPTPQDKEIMYVGNPCGESFPLTGLCTECTGDCDSDADCEGDLKCFQRDGGEDVPGCIFPSTYLKADADDYCYSPESLEGVVRYVRECDDNNPCDRCEGDCDDDSNCSDGLKCYQRDAFEAVPGCTGEGGVYDRGAKDMCYSPDDLEGFVRYVRECDDNNPCDRCEGDCDGDSNCAGSLKCYQRDAFEAVPGCTGEGGTFDISAKDICYSSSPVAPTPTPPTPTTPSPTSSCEDSPFRFRTRKDGKNIFRDCTWVATRATASRCKLPGVSKQCPSTCDTCSTCVDATNRFKFNYNGKYIARDCLWVARKNTFGRCRNISGMRDTCRSTCNNC